MTSAFLTDSRTRSASTSWTRLAVPTGAVAGVTSGTYFRLGAYNSAEEAGLVPTYKYSRSEVVATDMTPTLSSDGAAEYNNPDYGLAETQAVDPSATSKADNYASGDGNLITDSGSGTTNSGTQVRNSTRQFEELLLTIKKQSFNPLNYGLLAKTDGDLVANVGGGGIFKFSEGVALTTLNGDVNVDAPLGTVAIASQNGVKITAGSASKRANIALTAFGYIKQTAYGPLDDVRYSTSKVTTYGWAKEWFYGEKFFEIHGTNTSNLYGVDQKANFAQQRYVTFAAKISFQMSTSLDMAVGVEMKIWVGFTLGLALSGRIDFQAAFTLKFNAGYEFKYVSAMDLKMTAIDFKNVGLDGKIAKFKIDVNSIAKLDKELARVNDEMIKAKMTTMEAEAGSMTSSVKALRSLF